MVTINGKPLLDMAARLHSKTHVPPTEIELALLNRALLKFLENEGYSCRDRHMSKSFIPLRTKILDLSQILFVPLGMKSNQPSNRSRGRPLAFDPNEALDAAMHVFWLKGYEGASLSDLTEAMGINKPSLYAQFDDKRTLFLAAIEHYNATIGAPHLEKLLDGKTVRETVAGYFSAINITLTSPDSPPGCMVGSVATDMAGRDEEIRVHVANLFASTEVFLTQRFKELGDAPIDEHTLAEIVVSFGQSLAARARVGATLPELNARTDRFLSVLLGADEPVPPD